MKATHHLPKNVQKIWERISKTEKEDTLLDREQELRNELSRLQLEIKIVQDHFENETDFDLIDAHIWELKSLEVRYDRAIRQAKIGLQNACG